MMQTETSQSAPRDNKVEPAVRPDVATEPHPTIPAGDSGAVNTGVGGHLLEEALPEITEAARKVGGFKRLAEIAAQLDSTQSGN